MNQHGFGMNENQNDDHQAEDNQGSEISSINQDEEAFFVAGTGAERTVEVPAIQENTILAPEEQPSN